MACPLLNFTPRFVGVYKLQLRVCVCVVCARGCGQNLGSLFKLLPCDASCN